MFQKFWKVSCKVVCMYEWGGSRAFDNFASGRAEENKGWTGTEDRSALLMRSQVFPVSIVVSVRSGSLSHKVASSEEKCLIYFKC